MLIGISRIHKYYKVKQVRKNRSSSNYKYGDYGDDIMHRNMLVINMMSKGDNIRKFRDDHGGNQITYLSNSFI